LRLDTANSFQALPEYILFCFYLLLIVKVLEHASATDAEVWTAGFNPMGRWIYDFNRLAFKNSLSPAFDCTQDRLTRERPFNKHHSAIKMGDTATIVTQVTNEQF